MPMTGRGNRLPEIVLDLNKLRTNTMKLKLVTFSNNICTMGKLYNDDDLICHTFELPWRDNNVNISCIPAGEYKIKMTNSNKFGPTYKVLDVEGRTEILIHKGNTAYDTQGCIMPCSTFGLVRGLWAGLSSKAAYDKLMALLEGDNHTLTIERH